MRDMWDWDVLTERFVCSKGNYVWDYKNNVLRGEKNGKSLSFDESTEEYQTTDSSFPCHETTGDIAGLKSSQMSRPEYIGRPYRFMVINVRGVKDKQLYLWPMKTTEGYRADYMEHQSGTRIMYVVKVQSDKPPIGFKEQTANGLLTLISGEPPPKMNPQNYVWWSITSGKFDYFRFLDTPKPLSIEDIHSPVEVVFNKDQEFIIIFSIYSDKIEAVNSELGCSANGLYKYETPGDSTSKTTLIVESGYIVFQIKNSQLIIDDIPPITLSSNIRFKISQNE